MPGRLPRPTLLVAVAVALFAVACSIPSAPVGSPRVSGPPAPSSSAVPPSDSPAPSAAAAAILLKVTSEGGFINPTANLAALPIVAVYGDGRILTPGPVDAIAPGPLVIPVQVRNVGPAGATSILAAIRTAGLDKPATGGPGIPGDSGTNIFAVTIDGQTTETRLSENGPGVGGPGAPGGGSADPGKAAAFDLLNRLLDPAETWGAAGAAPTTLAPAGYRIYVAPGAPPTDASTAQAPVAWPLALPLDQFGTPAVPDRGIAGLRQGVVKGADATTLGPILARATSATAFTSGGKSYTLWVRALLPDELGG